MRRKVRSLQSGSPRPPKSRGPKARAWANRRGYPRRVRIIGVIGPCMPEGYPQLQEGDPLVVVDTPQIHTSLAANILVCWYSCFFLIFVLFLLLVVFWSICSFLWLLNSQLVKLDPTTILASSGLLREFALRPQYLKIPPNSTNHFLAFSYFIPRMRLLPSCKNFGAIFIVCLLIIFGFFLFHASLHHGCVYCRLAKFLVQL